jgi:hypothetical protein
MPELKPEVQLEPHGGRESSHVAAPPLSPPSLHQQTPVHHGHAVGKSSVPLGDRKAERPVKRKRGWVKGRPRTKFGATPKIDDKKKKKKDGQGEGDDEVSITCDITLTFL